VVEPLRQELTAESVGKAVVEAATEIGDERLLDSLTKLRAWRDVDGPSNGAQDSSRTSRSRFSGRPHRTKPGSAKDRESPARRTRCSSASSSS
jgi:hypothetical protein